MASKDRYLAAWTHKNALCPRDFQQESRLAENKFRSTIGSMKKAKRQSCGAQVVLIKSCQLGKTTETIHEALITQNKRRRTVLPQRAVSNSYGYQIVLFCLYV